jgi:hypothetical protein
MTPEQLKTVPQMGSVQIDKDGEPVMAIMRGWMVPLAKQAVLEHGGIVDVRVAQKITGIQLTPEHLVARGYNLGRWGWEKGMVKIILTAKVGLFQVIINRGDMGYIRCLHQLEALEWVLDGLQIDTFK